MLAALGNDADAGPEDDLGRRLVRLIFASDGRERDMPAPLAGLIASPDSDEALTALDLHIEDRLEQDPGLAARVGELLTGFFRQQFDSGDGQALAELGDLLWWDDPPWAQAAYERAVEAGNHHALLDLAKLRDAALGDVAASLRTWREAAGSADPDVAAEALVEIGRLHAGQWDAPAAQAAFAKAMGTQHPRWAAQAMIGLGDLLLHRLGDQDGAVAMFRQAIESGDADSRACALVQLAHARKNRGDVAGAKEAWQQAIDSRAGPWAEIALSDLVNQLEREGDLDGVRAAYRTAVQTGNPDAPRALVAIGNLLKKRGDIDGWRQAWEQAVDTGFVGADDIRELLSMPAAGEAADEAEDDLADEVYPADLPPQFDPGNMAQTGIAVLARGLPPLPDVLTYQMAIPVAHWTASQHAVVLFLRFHGRGPRKWPMAIMMTFSRDHGLWTADSQWVGTGFDHDAIANPGDLESLDGRAMVVSGEARADQPVPGDLAVIWQGRAASEVRQIALIQDGREDRRPLDNHFGAWVVCTEKPSPFHVTALDQDGAVLADIT
jgi:tetratricopeptide (TPR) repeat protein